MKERKYLSLPVEIIENKTMFSFDDSLIPVDLKVMHNGLNLNNSTFEDRSIEDAKESLKNKPILGYIKKVDGTDQQDFSGHEVEFTWDESGLKITYLERPIGLIGETNNYAILEEDDKKYVTCRGYLWREYLNSGYEILKDNPEKSVSMEIAVDDYEINEDGTINITKYRYLGVTVLGDNVSPAMRGAKLTVVGQFSEEYSDDFYKKIEDLNEKLKNSLSTEGGENEVSVPSPIVFELSHDDIRAKIFDILNPRDEEGYRIWNYWIMEVYDTHVDVSDEHEADTYWRFPYTIDENEEVTLGDKERIYYVALTQEEKDALDEMRTNYSTLETEVQELREYKETKEAAEYEAQQEKERQEKIDYVNTEYEGVPEEIRNQFIEKIDEYASTKDIDSDMCIYIVKNKLDFSKANTIKVGVDRQKQNIEFSPYGELSYKFNKVN